MHPDTRQAASNVRLDLPNDPSAAAAARRQVTSVLAGWQLGLHEHQACLVASELVGNALRHGLPPVWMTLSRLDDGVRIDVHDDDPRPPGEVALAHDGLPDLDAEGGRGLFLVEALSSSNGWSPMPDDGKLVWAVVGGL